MKGAYGFCCPFCSHTKANPPDWTIEITSGERLGEKAERFKLTRGKQAKFHEFRERRGGEKCEEEEEEEEAETFFVVGVYKRIKERMCFHFFNI